MISIYLKDNVLTTQSGKFIEDLKPKTKKGKKKFSKKCMCIALDLSRLIVEFVSKERAFHCPVPHQTDKTGGQYFPRRLLHPPRPVLPICLPIARAKPTKILKANFFQKIVSFLCLTN